MFFRKMQQLKFSEGGTIHSTAPYCIGYIQADAIPFVTAEELQPESNGDTTVTWWEESSSHPVVEAITNIQELLPEYWAKTLDQRLDGPTRCGSFFPGITTREELESLVHSVEWEVPWAHDMELLEGCTAFWAKIPGRLGIVSLQDLPSDYMVVLDDRKNTGKVSAVVSGGDVSGEEVGFATIILGEEQGKQVVFTLHPGKPVRPSSVAFELGMHGKKITVQEALEMGLTTAKIG